MSSSSTPSTSSTRRSALADGLFLATCAGLLGTVPTQRLAIELKVQ
jgi:hypothetical protein